MGTEDNWGTWSGLAAGAAPRRARVPRFGKRENE